MIDAGGRIVLLNAEVERLFGYAREELLGRPVETLVPERYRTGHPIFRGEFLKNPSARAMGAGRDLFGLRKDGTEVPVEIGLKPVATDEGVFVISSIVDITARKRAEAERHILEDQLRQAQKMEAVGTLAGGIAHDFNNILAAIIGYGEMVQAAAPSPQASSDLAELLAAATRGKHVVEKILAFSRRQELARQPVDLSRTVRDVQTMLRASLPSTITLEVRLHPSTPRISADVTSVQQILMNLATNSSHAMPAGGSIEILLEPFYARDSYVRARPGLREGEYAMLSVRDSGAGIAAEIKNRVFEPFFTTKEPGSGSGLGLAMVHAIMRDHGGWVELESEPGQGTEIRCLFPALDAPVQPTSAQQPADAAPAPRANGERILLVEDEASLMRMGVRRLLDLGYAATGETDPAQALAMIQERPDDFDLLLTDFTMPKMTGLELARAATAAKPGLKIVMMTGFIEEMPEDVLRAVGIRRLLRKPQTLPELAAGLRDTLDAN